MPPLRFGAQAVALGLAAEPAVTAALARQTVLRAAGQLRQVGALLVEDGALTAAAVVAVLAAQGREIRGCMRCGARTTVASGLPPGEPPCGTCGAPCERIPRPLAVDTDGTALDPRGGSAIAHAGGAALLGRTLGGLTLREVLGEGGMGVVYRAVHPLMERTAAVKVLPAALAVDRERAQRFLREAALMARVRHPNVVAVRNVGDEDGLPFIEMEFVEGESLEARLRREGRLPLAAAVPLMRGVAAGLAAAHAVGVVHRDVKPGNVLLARAGVGTPDGEARLVDFGLARGEQESGSLTATGAVMGTPDYMAPEQCRGAPAGPATDVYAFGVMFYRVLTGRLPFTGASPIEVIQQHLHRDADPPRRHVPDLPAAQDGLIERCLAKNPAERFADGAALVAALDAVERGEQLAYVSRRRRRQRVRVAVIAASACGLGFLTWGAAAAVEGLRAGRTASPSQRVADHLTRGRNLIAAGQLWEAQGELREVLAIVREQPEARRLLTAVQQVAAARHALTQGQTADAARAVEAAVSAAPELPAVLDIQQAVGTAVRRDAALREATEALHRGAPDAARHALETLPDDPAIVRRRREAELMALAQSAASDAQFGKAHATWEQLRRSDPANPTARQGSDVAYGLLEAGAHAARGQLLTAFARAAAVAAMAPADAGAAREQARYREQILVEAHAAHARGDAAEARRLLDGLLSVTGDDREAAGLAESWRRDEEAHGAAMRRAEAAMREGLAEDAVREYERAVSLRESPEAVAGLTAARVRRFIAMAETARAGGRWVEAVQHLAAAEALGADPATLPRHAGSVRAEGLVALIATARRALRAGALDDARAALDAAGALRSDAPEVAALAAELTARAAAPPGTVYLPAGVVQLRTGAGEGTRAVALVAPLHVAVHETTHAEFLAFVRDAGYLRDVLWSASAPDRAGFVTADQRSPGPATWRGPEPTAAQADWPVTGVSWYEADAYARWRGGRLPTPDEWEAAASVDPATGRASAYPWGEAFAAGASAFPGGPGDGIGVGPVGGRPVDQSPIGCLDMGGNVAEWTDAPLPGPGGFFRICGGAAASPVPDRDARPGQRRFLGDGARMRAPIVGFRVVFPVEGR